MRPLLLLRARPVFQALTDVAIVTFLLVIAVTAIVERIPVRRRGQAAARHRRLSHGTAIGGPQPPAQPGTGMLTVAARRSASGPAGSEETAMTSPRPRPTRAARRDRVSRDGRCRLSRSAYPTVTGSAMPFAENTGQAVAERRRTEQGDGDSPGPPDPMTARA